MTEARLFFQEGRNHHSVMIFISYRSDSKVERPPLLLFRDTTLLTIKEHLELRNIIKDLLDEDAYEE